MIMKNLIIFLLVLLPVCFLSALEKKMNQTIELKKGEKVELKDPDSQEFLLVEFLGAGYEEGENDYHASTASFKIKFGRYDRESLMLTSVKGKPGQSRFENFLIILEFSDGIEKCNIRVKKEYPLVVVFKKEVKLDKAKEIMAANASEFHEGMDSSRGKHYFYQTGPKFIAYFYDKDSFEKFQQNMEDESVIYEIYEPDWHIHKD